MEAKKKVKVFISYAHKDKIYYELLIEGIKTYSKNSATFDWETWDDNLLNPGQLWHESIKEQIRQCNFAILLVSGNFLYSDYIKQEEFSDFLARQRSEGFLFFPIMVGPCDFTQWKELGERQFFKPAGADYGRPDKKDFTYADLVKYRETDGQVLPNPERDRYHMNLVKALEGAMEKCAAIPRVRTELTRGSADYFKMVKPGETLEPGDILFGKRATTNADFYWERESDAHILAALQKNESLLILGNSLAGKTRALYEALKKLENILVLVPKDKPNIDVPFALPERNGRRLVAVFDDIDQILKNYTKEKLEELISRLLVAGVVIAATCRRGDEYLSFASAISDKIRDEFTRITIEKMDEIGVAAFKKYIEEKAPITRKVKLDEGAFDHNIGSYFMEVTRMSDRYRELELKIKKYNLQIPDNLPREILRALKYFYYTENMAGKSRFEIAGIKDFCERSLLGKETETRGKKLGTGWQGQLDQFSTRSLNKEYTPGEWKNALKILSDSEYELNFIEISEPHILVEEVYLESVVENELKLARVFKILEDTYRGDDLQAHGFMTNVFAFTRLINSVKTVADGRKILDKIKFLGLKSNEVTFTSLINKAQTFAEAADLWEDMKKEGLKPNEVTFTSLINKAQTFAEAQALLDTMKKEGLKPNEITFNSLINKAQSFPEAQALWETMKKEGIKPNEVTFTSLINKAQTFADAQALWETMKKEGLKPDEVTFTSLINKAQTFAEAASLLDTMKKEGLKPNEVTFNSLINKAQTYAEAASLLDTMKKEDLKPNEYTRSSLIKIARQNPHAAMDNLLKYPTAILFADFLFNRIIGEVCKQDPSCLELIFPHIPVLCQQEDAIILHYAKLFEFSETAGPALTLLECLKAKSFDYFNIKANCLKNTNPTAALDLYSQALQEAGDNRRKTIVLNNMAQLIFDQKMTLLYAHAASYCRQALSLRPFSEFPYPGDLLVLFTIIDSPEDQVILNVTKIMKEFGIGKKTIAALSHMIADPVKKAIIIGWNRPPKNNN